jgi:hypothetical protein
MIQKNFFADACMGISSRRRRRNKCRNFFKPNLGTQKQKRKENNNNSTGDENLRTPGGGGFSMSMFYGTLEISRADKAATAHDSPI